MGWSPCFPEWLSAPAQAHPSSASCSMLEITRAAWMALLPPLLITEEGIEACMGGDREGGRVRLSVCLWTCAESVCCCIDLHNDIAYPTANSIPQERFKVRITHTE